MSAVVHGYYGKLPVSPEFLRLHASGPELRWLDEWLQQGILYAKAQEGRTWPERVQQARPFGFSYVPAQQGRVVCGTIIASQDQAGRAFPFLSYLLMEREEFASSPWLVPVAMGRFLEDTRLIIGRMQDDHDWEACRRTLEDRTVGEPDVAAARATFDRFTQATTVGQWCFGDATTVGEAQRLAAEHLLTRVAKVRSQGTQGIRFPIGVEPHSDNFDLAFWLQLYLQPQAGQGQPQGGMFCCWTRAQGVSTALLSIGPGSPNVVRFLVNPEAKDEAWVDMTSPMPDLALETVDGATLSHTMSLEQSLATLAMTVREHRGPIGAGNVRMEPESARRGFLTMAML